MNVQDSIVRAETMIRPQAHFSMGDLFNGGPGLHLEIDPRGGKMSIYEKEEGAKPCVHVHKHMYTSGVWGHAPPRKL